MPISGLEPRLSGVGGNHSANCATTDAFPVIPLLAFDHLISESCFKGISHWSHLCSNPLGPLSRKKDQIQHSNCANDFNHLLCPSIFLLFYNSILFYLSIFLLIYISILFPSFYISFLSRFFHISILLYLIITLLIFSFLPISSHLNLSPFILKSGPFPASFYLFSSFSIQLIINKCSIKFCR